MEKLSFKKNMDKEESHLNVAIIGAGMGLFCQKIGEAFPGMMIEPIIPVFFYGTAYLSVVWYMFTTSKFTKLFKNLNLMTGDICYPLLDRKKKTGHSIQYFFTLPAGLCLQDFKDNQEAIEQFIGHKVNITYIYQRIVIEVFIKELSTHIDYEPVSTDGNVPMLVGYDRTGEPIICDLSDGEPHVLIAGESGSGKSTVLRSMITNLILETNVGLHLIDLKNGAEFNIFQKSNRVNSFSRTIREAEKTLGYLSTEVDRRYDLFYEYGVKDIIEYNKKFPKESLTFEVLIIDEFADLQNNRYCKSILDSLGRRARACGVHMIISTQRPDSKVLDGNIKANITNIVGLKTLNSTNSSIIIGEVGLEKLNGKGHGIFKRGDTTEFQAPYLDVTKCIDLIKHTYVKKEYTAIREDKVDFKKVVLFDANN